ncbi:MAG: glycosyltransferase family 4 protein [Nitrospinae bacterium]|nr:glycosyltransferase family 4 protein [Nitrospinota bacterium]
MAKSATIVFDMRALQAGYKAHKTRGIGVYARNLARRMSLSPAGLAWIPMFDPRFENEWLSGFGALPLQPGAVSSVLRPVVREFLTQLLFMRPALDRFAREQKAGLIFFPTHLDAPPGLCVPYAVTAHDMIQSALRKEHYNSIKHRLHIESQKKALNGARLVIAISHHTKQDVIKHAGVDPEKIVVIYNGVDPVFRPGAGEGFARLTLPEKFVLNVGGIDFRKNISLLLTAFCELSRKHPDYRLVVTGEITRDPQYGSFTRMVDKLGLAEKIITTGYVSTEELAALYNRARMMFYPSVYEGFGLPVAEAMACGAPVISTNCSSIPEVAGEAAILLPPDKPEAFAQALITLAENEGERERLKKAGIERAAMFTWEECARKTFEALAAATG